MELHKSNIQARDAALRFKLIQTRRRRFLSRCSRCRSLRAHAEGRWGRVHRDDDLFEVLDEVHGCPYVVQYVTYHARRAADVQKCKASRRGAIVWFFHAIAGACRAVTLAKAS